MDSGARGMIIILSAKADLDLSEIWNYNAERYGVEHADKHKAFLMDGMTVLAERP